MIDEERALEIIDQMRISVPEEIEKSARVLTQRDRILAEAHEEAARIVQEHRKKAENMLDHDATVRAAQARAESIKEQARQEASRITAEADQYVVQLLASLEQQLARNINEVRNGITVLQQALPSAQPQQEEESSEAQPIEIPQQAEPEAELVEAQPKRRNVRDSS